MIHLVHLPLDPRAFAAWSSHRNLAPKGRRDDGLALHVLLSAMFGKGVLQPFRLFAPEQGRWTIYAYTDTDAASLTVTASRTAPPEMLATLPLESLRSKPLPQLQAGLRLGFDLRARPVRRQTTRQGGQERDAFQLAAEAGDGASPDRATVYRGWLAERLSGAADLADCRLSAFERQRVIRNGRTVEGPDATLQGTLVVTGADRFAAILARGVGRHCAYGYGMLMLRPLGQEVRP
jgi:CRISPR system Cascade subunit CasE